MGDNSNNKKHQTRGMGIYFLMLMIIVGAYMWFTTKDVTSTDNYTYREFSEDLKANKIDHIDIKQNKEVPTGRLVITMKKANKDGSEHINILYVSNINKIEEKLEKTSVKFTLSDVEKDSNFSSIFISIISVVVIGVLMFVLMNRVGMGGANARAMNYGKNKARLSNPSENKINFSQVAGLKEEKEDLEEIVDFLKKPEKYIKLGARIPKGVILVGPPGTGKTLLAKAVAGEAKVPFYSISGSDFVEMFVGVGASRVREMFAEAKKNSPCIIFIDEIDAVARKRGTGMGGGHDEREQTLNQLLVEMDGFGVNAGIIVMAATNRVDILDPAILRPGRFDRQVSVGVPDVRGREEILRVHSKNKPLGDDVDLKAIASASSGFSGADIENLMNEAAIRAAKENRPFITEEDIKKSFIKVGIGTEKKSRIVTDKEKKITAFHEAGHAILYHVLPDEGPVYTVSIIPTGRAAGYTMKVPEKDEMFNTKGKMLQSIMVSLGGRIAEEQVFDDITTGASQDIKQATMIAKAMVTKYGMSDDIGLVCYDDENNEVVIGRDIAHSRGYGEDTAKKIDAEVKRIIDDCYKKAKDILKENDDVLHRLAELLLEKERIGRSEFESLFND